ncbi:MAG: CinA family protein [Eubacterium sp.]|nr:CinA family protein [Eubacterium sp.]
MITNNLNEQSAGEQSVNEQSVINRFHDLTNTLINNNLTISTMESCTGGLVGALLSDMEGASAVVPGGVFTYSNEMKIRHGVPADIISEHGVYSTETAIAMAGACRQEFHTDVGIGITGSIGAPDPNNADSIPGEVFVAVDYRNHILTEQLEVPVMDRRKSRLFIAEKTAGLIKSLFVQ